MGKPEYQESTALASLGGYVYQLMWGLLALVKNTNKDSRISIEVLDDVAIEFGAQVALQQAKKTADKSKSPFTDLNINLWKTFSIWVSYAKENDPDCTRTEFHLVTNAEVKEGHLVDQLKTQKTPTSIENFIEAARQLWSKTESDDVKRKIQNCISADNLETFKKILSKCTVIDSSSSSGSVMSDIYNNMAVPENVNAEIFQSQIVGWYAQGIMSKLEAGEQLWFERKDYNQVHAYTVISCMTPQTIGSDVLTEKADSEYQQLAQNEIYIKQLKLIQISKSRHIESAIHDYYRFSLTKDKTIANGEVLASEWDKDSERLKQFWQQTSQIEERAAEDDLPDHKIGQRIFGNCSTCTGLPPLNGNDREAFVISGHFHVLADEESVWWHPNYHDVKDK